MARKFLRDFALALFHLLAVALLSPRSTHKCACVVTCVSRFQFAGHSDITLRIPFISDTVSLPFYTIVPTHFAPCPFPVFLFRTLRLGFILGLCSDPGVFLLLCPGASAFWNRNDCRRLLFDSHGSFLVEPTMWGKHHHGHLYPVAKYVRHSEALHVSESCAFWLPVPPCAGGSNKT